MRTSITLALALALAFTTSSQAACYYIAPTGSDSNPGTKSAPRATVVGGQQLLSAGDTLYMRGGTYVVQESEIMSRSDNGAGAFSYVYQLNKAGINEAHRTCYFGYPGERPVFDFSHVLPNSRVSAFSLVADYLHLRNFDIVGVKVPVTGHAQSECISARKGSCCIVENIAMHDGMAIGYYQTSGHNNLVLNCDAYCNIDTVSAKGVSGETLGGNVDGFGCHVTNESRDTANVFRGCRAWWNSDDGFDLINCKCKVVIDSCWSFYNGYIPNGNKSIADGNGFKAGGYGMSSPVSGNPAVIPMHEVKNCVAFYNRANGFYANHHLGGLLFANNTAMYNSNNYRMTNRKTANTDSTPAENVNGYGHILINNVSYNPNKGLDYGAIDSAKCELRNNHVVSDASVFINATRLSPSNMYKISLTAAREADGRLPEQTFLVAPLGGVLEQAGAGYAYTPWAYDLSIGESTWASLYLEYPVRLPQAIEAYYVIKMDSVATMRRLPAGCILNRETPVFLHSEEATGLTLSYAVATAYKADTAVVHGNLLSGTLADSIVAGGSTYVLSSSSPTNSEDVGLYLYGASGSTVTLRNHSAYLNIHSPSAAPALLRMRTEESGAPYENSGESAARKVMIDGRLYIEYQGRLYDLLGR